MKQTIPILAIALAAVLVVGATAATAQLMQPVQKQAGDLVFREYTHGFEIDKDYKDRLVLNATCGQPNEVPISGGYYSGIDFFMIGSAPDLNSSSWTVVGYVNRGDIDRVEPTKVTLIVVCMSQAELEQ